MTGAGLCETCAHARTITSDRGSKFTRCALSDQRREPPEEGPRFAKYPRLPVLACPGYQSTTDPSSGS